MNGRTETVLLFYPLAQTGKVGGSEVPRHSPESPLSRVDEQPRS